MFKDVSVGNKTVPMLATASTAYRYKQIFHEDFLMLAEKGVEGTEALEMAQRLAFVMAMQAGKADFSALSVESYLVWIDGFEVMDFAEAMNEILDVFQGNAKTSVEAKKKAEQQPAH